MNAADWVTWTIHGLSDGVATFDRAGRVVSLNPVAEVLTGWTLAEARGRALEEVIVVVADDMQTAVENPARGALHDGAVVSPAQSLAVLGRDESLTPIRARASPILDEQGGVAGAVLLLQIAGDRHRSTHPSALLADLVDSCVDAIVGVSLDGAILSWNTAAERLLGYPAAEVIGRQIRVVLPSVPPGPHDHGVADGATGERLDSLRSVARTRAGAVLPVLLTTSPIRDRNRRVIGASTIVRDASVQVRAEQAQADVLRRERAAHALALEASHAKDEFVATISHELRTPLNAVLGWAQRLNMGGVDDATRERAAQIIERNARAQAQLLDDLLDVTRAMTGKLRINAAPVDVASSLDAALESIRPAAEAKAIELEVRLDGVGAQVIADVDRLQQVFWNLLSNAVKFTPRQGRVTVSVCCTQEQVEIRVKDTGIGIPADLLTRIFDRFVQADASGKEGVGGLGLGLSIVRHIVELHGGTVSAHSPGQARGSTFLVQLPMTARREPTASTSVSAPAGAHRHATALAGVRVLVVDDQAETRELLAALLSARGAAVRTSASARDARAEMTAWLPTVIVSDVGMPDEDGCEFMRTVRRRPSAFQHVPAIALTAHGREADRARALDAGFQRHVLKPVDEAELTQAVAALAGPAHGPSD